MNANQEKLMDITHLNLGGPVLDISVCVGFDSKFFIDQLTVYKLPLQRYIDKSDDNSTRTRTRDTSSVEHKQHKK